MLMLSITGCWNRRELNTLGIVMGIGIDKANNKDEVTVTAQLVNTDSSKASSKEQTSSGKSDYINISGSGINIMPVLRNLTHQTSRKLYVAHNQIIIFGEAVAKQGLQDYLDFFLRDHECRLTVNVLVSKGKASDILSVEPQLAKMSATEINQLLEAQTATSETARLTVFELMQHLESRTFAAVAPIVDIAQNNEGKVANISGGAVFKGDQLVGELNKTETRGFLWVMDKVKSGTIAIEVKGQKAIIEIVKASSQITSTLNEDNTAEFIIKIKQTGTIATQTGLESLSTSENVKLIEKEVEKAIQSEIQASIDKAKALNSDIFGFGESINRKHAKKWSKIEQDWDSLFKAAVIDIQVESKIVAGGRLAKPNNPK